jgi:hypothetical protein
MRSLFAQLMDTLVLHEVPIDVGFLHPDTNHTIPDPYATEIGQWSLHRLVNAFFHISTALPAEVNVLCMIDDIGLYGGDPDVRQQMTVILAKLVARTKLQYEGLGRFKLLVTVRDVCDWVSPFFVNGLTVDLGGELNMDRDQNQAFLEDSERLSCGCPRASVKVTRRCTNVC